jgi:hypothetical protein
MNEFNMLFIDGLTQIFLTDTWTNTFAYFYKT